ncbi:ATP-binding protein [Pseudomonas sp. SHC52]|jgi:energy-coupling factor transporter ATP-binding protein EcfA2|uniref:ATP-binding protein n=1 Tax=Pseudomonas sp. SHC52 TaxID=984195 RepID=UPI000537D648|nr:ATP-binding protein [Pseudomonas sp. SHC52]CDF95478.1 Transposon Tn7 transposition protein tnsC [Pseudomonas sp. SHC52]
MSDFSFAPADYTPTGMPQYDGNPLIECLPKILSDIDVVRRVGNHPKRPDEAERALDPKLRGHGINRLKDVVVPFEIHLRLEDLFSQLIRYGYTGRNPLLVSSVRHRMPSSAEIQRQGFMSTAETMTLIGLSGMGKTTALNSIAKLYPQVISHSRYKEQIFIETQVVWLKIECPHDGSLRGFCSAFFSALDVALGIDKYSRKGGAGNSISVMLQHLSQLCKTFYIGALIIDEMQHLCSSRGGQDREKLLNFFVTLSNDAGVPLVYVGTNAMLPLFSGVLRNARRAAGMGPIAFDRFTEDDPFWSHLVSQLWAYDWTASCAPLTDELLATIYDLTQGNTDFLAKLLMLTQRHVIWEGIDSITSAVLQQVYDTQMRLLHKPIEALRSGDPLQIADFEDMMPTKDQIAQMMNYDLARRADRTHLSLLTQASFTTPAEPIANPVAKVASRPLVPVAEGSLKSAHFSKDEDVQTQLEQRGWVDKDSAW